MPHCALHHSAVISLNFVVCSIGTPRGFAPLRILCTQRRHGVTCQESSPHTPSVRRSPGIPGRQSRQASPFQQTRQSGFTLQNSPCTDSGLLRPLLGTAGEHRHRDRGACRARCYASKRRHELAPLHSIALSAPASSVAGTVSPRTFAVLRLIASSNFEA